MHTLRQHLGISLRLGDVGVPHHARYILYLDTLREHPCAEGMTSHVGVQLRNTDNHPDSLQHLVVSLVVYLGYLHAVTLQYIHGGRQQHADVRHTRLDTLTHEGELSIHLAILVNIKTLRVAI